MTNSGYNAGRKKAVVGADRNKLDYITNWLKRSDVGVHVTKSEHRFENVNFRTSSRETDLMLNGKVHLQHDTIKVHCELGMESFEGERGDKDKKRNKTAKRNADYFDLWMETGQPFVVLNQDLAKILDLNEGALTAYLYYHAMMLENARMEAMA